MVAMYCTIFGTENVLRMGSQLMHFDVPGKTVKFQDDEQLGR